MKKAMTLSIRLSVTAILLLSIHPVLSLAQTTPKPSVPQIGSPPPSESPTDRKKREKREGELAKKELEQKKK